MSFNPHGLKTVGARIKYAIASKGKTAADIERETRVAKSYISRVVNDKIVNPKKFVKIIAGHLLVSEEWLMHGRGNICIDPDLAVSVFDVSTEKFRGSVIVEDDSVQERSLKAWRGFDVMPYSRESVIITSDRSDYPNGDYVLKHQSQTLIATRLNHINGTRWYHKDSLESIDNIDEFEILGAITAFVADPFITKIEKML